MVKPSDKTIRLKKNDASTEQKVLAAARREFISEGLKGARMQAIADRAGVNKALLHYYFRTKEKLYDAVLEDILNTVWTVLREKISRTEGADDIRSLLRLVVEAYIRTLTANPDFPRVMLRELSEGGERLPRLIDSFIASFGEVPARINELLRQEMRRGTLREIKPVHLAINVLGMCVFTFLARPILTLAAERGAVNLRFDAAFYNERIESIVSLVCCGIFKERVQ